MTSKGPMLIAALALGWSSGCGDAPPDPRETTDTSSTAGGEQTAEHHVEVPPAPGAVATVRGEGATEEEAYAAAVAGLRAAIYGRGAEALAFDVHDRSRDAVRIEPRDGGGFVAEVSIARERSREVLDTLASAPPPSVPAPLAEQIAPLYAAHVARLTCERRRAWLGETCEAPDGAAVADGARAIASSLRLRSQYRGGVPLDANDRPLRSPTVVVELVGADGTARPIAGVPVAARIVDGAPLAPATSDATGTARVALPSDAPWSGTIEIAIDRAALLGALATAFPPIAVQVRGRRIALDRWAAAIAERVAASPARDAVFTAAVREALVAQGARHEVRLPRDVVDRIVRTPEPQRTQEVVALADAQAGALDVVLVGEIDSEFASRMGTQRVWFEARGRLEAIDAWTGRTLASVTASTTAADVGDQRADHAARRALARDLVTRLLETPGLRPEGGAQASLAARTVLGL